MSLSLFTADENRRYDRQLLLPEIGEAGQLRLKSARVLVIGAGGLGSAACLYLAAAGVGSLGIADADRVDLSNLQRQILHSTAAVDTAKTTSAKQRLAELNPQVAVTLFDTTVNPGNIGDILSGFDMALGCVDNFATRYVLNAACVDAGLPNVFASAARWEGQASVFGYGGGPCYRCFFQEPPPPDWRPAPADQAVVGTSPGIMGCIQATEALKIILGVGRVLSGRLLLYDGLTMRFREIAVKRDPDCPVCGWPQSTPTP